MSIQIHCPNCNSENVQSFSIIHSFGTSEIHTNSTTSESLFYKDHFAIGREKTKTSGVQQSEIGKLTAPPTKRQIGFRVFLGWFLITMLFLKFPGGLLGNTLALLFTLAIGFGIYQAIKYNRTIWPKLYEEWKNKFQCNTCGWSFVYKDDKR